jgi:hypothetical protein
LRFWRAPSRRSAHIVMKSSHEIRSCFPLA